VQLKTSGDARTDQLQPRHRSRLRRRGLQQESGNDLGRDFLGHGARVLPCALGWSSGEIEEIAGADCLPQAL
jgi:hypothetical protein